MPVVLSTVSSMYEVAVAYRDLIVAAMTSTEAGAPDRAFVAPDQPVFETQCAQAAVYIPSLTEGGTGPAGPPEQIGQRFHRGRVNLVGMRGYAIRCAAISENNQAPYEPLLDTTLDAQAKAVYEDGWAVWNYLNAALNANLVFGGQCGIVHFDPASPYAEEGGLMGWQFPIRVELTGYIPDLSGLA